MLRVTFYWGHDDLDDYTEDDLPVQVELPALPPVGTLVNFRSPMDNRKITAVVLPDAFELHITSDGSLYEIGVEPAY